MPLATDWVSRTFQNPANLARLEPQDGLAPILRFEKCVIRQIMSGCWLVASGSGAGPWQNRRSRRQPSGQVGGRSVGGTARWAGAHLAVPKVRYQADYVGLLVGCLRVWGRAVAEPQVTASPLKPVR